MPPGGAQRIDLSTVLSLLEAVSGETDGERLTGTIVRLGLEYAGARRGLLILPAGDTHRIEVEAQVDGDTLRVIPRRSEVTAADLPESLLRQVLRTAEPGLLQAASASMLCMPLLKQARLVGVLYLESRHDSGALTPARMALVQLLASAAAVSLENAQVYREFQEREARVRRLVDSNIIGIVIWHTDGRILDANDAFLRIVGYDRGELLSGRVGRTDLTPPEWRERQSRDLAEVIETGTVQAHEREFLRKDGSRVPVLVGGAIFDGASDEGVAFVLDLTDRKRAEQALREREREARLIVNTIPGLVAILTPAGEVEVVNDQLVDYCGQPLADMKQWGTNGTVHADDLPRVADVFTHAIASGTPYDFEARIRRFDRSYRWFQVRGLPLRDTLGQVARWYVLLSDVDDRKRAEAELRHAHGHLNEAQRLSRTGSFITDLLADKRDWSEEAYRIFEFDRTTRITLQTIRNVVHPADLPGYDAAFEQAAAGVGFDMAFRIVTSAGHVKHLHAVGHVMEKVADRPVFIGAIQDVTASKVAESALDKARSELAHVARVTTLSALTASIAHEVNQPLSGIITNAGTCLRMLDADPPNISGARETAKRTIRDGNRAAEVIARLRALFSKRELTLEPMDLNDATREVVALSLSDLQRNGVILQSELAEGLPPVYGDRIQLQQVVLNLLRNAMDAMADVDRESRRLVIRTEQESGDRARLTVRDAGMGLDRENVGKLFDTFYTTKSGGMGIGLAVSRSIIEKHHGRLWAEANDGPGATFSFSIPNAPGNV